MLRIKQDLDIKKIADEFNFEHVFVHNASFYILKGKITSFGKTKQQEFISIHKELGVIECYGFEILDVIYEMTKKDYLEEV